MWSLCDVWWQFRLRCWKRYGQRCLFWGWQYLCNIIFDLDGGSNIGSLIDPSVVKTMETLCFLILNDSIQYNDLILNDLSDTGRVPNYAVQKSVGKGVSNTVRSDVGGEVESDDNG